MPSFKVLDILTLRVGTTVDPICITAKSALTIGGLALRSSCFFFFSSAFLSLFFSDLDSDLLSDLDSLLLSDFVSDELCSPPLLSDEELDEDDSPEEDDDWDCEDDPDEVDWVEDDAAELEALAALEDAADEALELAADAAADAACEAAELAA